MSTENVLNNCMLSYRKTSIESVHLAENAVKADRFGRLKKTAITTIYRITLCLCGFVL